MLGKLVALAASLSAKECPIERDYCVAFGGGHCEHFLGMMNLGINYYVACGAGEDDDDDASGNIIREGEGLRLQEAGSVPDGASDG
ncbi:MAG: hypothetical protein GWN93_06100 [Deltaproteobacteria bacterium]|nr:hypothetical protein [Deltaproteobacteria bacterium]